MAYMGLAGGQSVPASKSVPEMRNRFGLPSDRSIMLEPAFSSACSDIGAFSSAHGLDAGTFLIHRTGGSAYRTIQDHGLKTEWYFVTDTVHMTRQLGPDFEDLLAAKFHYHCSTHHVLLYVPDRALEKLDFELIAKGFYPPRAEHAMSFFAQALDGVIPRQYVMGVFEYEKRVFIPNAGFDPRHLPEEFPSLGDMKTRELFPDPSGAIPGYRRANPGEFGYVFRRS